MYAVKSVRPTMAAVSTAPEARLLAMVFTLNLLEFLAPWLGVLCVEGQSRRAEARWNRAGSRQTARQATQPAPGRDDVAERRIGRDGRVEWLVIERESGDRVSSRPMSIGVGR
jgi:hypothetical protein